jgi:hypothetical protein
VVRKGCEKTHDEVRNLFKEKSEQFDEEALIEIERHRSIQPLNDVKSPFEAQVAMCRAKNGELLTNKNQVL